jgi:hypothetical protein
LGLRQGEAGVVVDEHGDLCRWVEGAEPGLLVDASAQVNRVQGVVDAVDVVQLFQQDEDFVAWSC